MNALIHWGLVAPSPSHWASWPHPHRQYSGEASWRAAPGMHVRCMPDPQGCMSDACQMHARCMPCPWATLHGTGLIARPHAIRLMPPMGLIARPHATRLMPPMGLIARPHGSHREATCHTPHATYGPHREAVVFVRRMPQGSSRGCCVHPDVLCSSIVRSPSNLNLISIGSQLDLDANAACLFRMCHIWYASS